MARHQHKTAHAGRHAAAAILTALALLGAGPMMLLASEPAFEAAQQNAAKAAEALRRCHDFTMAWLLHADPKSGLIPRNLTSSPFWNARDSAADNYPFMVLTAALTDRPLFDGRLRFLLEQEKKLTGRVGVLPDDFLFDTQSFRNKDIDHRAIVFGASEYVKDGLLPLTEWLGPSPWSERMLELLEGVLDQAKESTPVGMLPATDHEVAGDLLQGLSRAYWMTRKERYRQAVFQIADFFLLHRLPTDQERLQLDDHGCEVIGGLAEAYFLAVHTDRERRERWRPAMHRMLDRILEVARDDCGFFYNLVNPKAGTVLNKDLTDNWGYDYNAFLAVAQLDGVERYRDAVRFVLSNLPKRRDYQWERGGADGYADSIEGGLNLLNRIPVADGFDWVEHSMAIMLKKQRADGIIEGWHGDGNYARTALMYALWKTQGTHVQPWRRDLAFGAQTTAEGTLCFALRADWPWTGRLLCDVPRHRVQLHMPADYPRLNQFPEWFTVEAEARYLVTVGGKELEQPVLGKDLHAGLPLRIAANRWVLVSVRKVSQ